jgi:tetratricopeptide (TPR) repeat protein
MTFWGFLIFLPFLVIQGCATSPPPRADSPLVPLAKANLEAVLEEQEGLEILWENAKEVRDFYRGGVQQKSHAEEKYREKSYSQALKLYDKSEEFLLVVLKYINHDSCEYTLFEGTHILFLPNLLMADNYLKTGKILKEMSRESSARKQWKNALPYIQQSLRCEHTEWGLAVERELNSLLESSKR